MRIILFLLTGLLALGGCGPQKEVTVSYDIEENQTVFETTSYTVYQARKLGSAVSSEGAKSVSVEAIAQCRGSDCTPDAVRLLFKVAGGGKLDLPGAGGEIIADETIIRWSSQEAGGKPNRGEGRLYTARGTFADVDLTVDQFEKIATASSIEGKIGGMPLNFEEGAQIGFQKLLRRFEGDDAAQGASASGEGSGEGA